MQVRRLEPKPMQPSAFIVWSAGEPVINETIEIEIAGGRPTLLVIPERSIALAADRISSKGRIEAWSL